MSVSLLTCLYLNHSLGIFAKEIVKFYTVITDPNPPKYIVRGICDNLGMSFFTKTILSNPL